MTMKVRALLLLGGVFLLVTAEKPTEGFFRKDHLSQPTNQVRVMTNVMIPMTDGTRLAADIYMPAKAGRYPALVHRTPYGKAGVRADGEYFAARGYALVAQDVRGRFVSEGDYYMLRDEAWGKNKDGYDTIEWIAAQPWCNGNVGSYGTSYSGMNSYLTAPTRPPHLKAMFPTVAFADFYHEQKYPGGALRLYALNWMIAQDILARHFRSNKDWTEWLKMQDGSAAGFYRSLLSQEFLDTIDHPDDGDYWQPWNVSKQWSQIDVPIYHHGGWYDRFTEGATANYAGITKSGFSEKARKSQKLIIGPWPHSSAGPRQIGEVDFGAEAEVDMNAVRVRWFDYWLKNIPNGIMEEPPISIFVMGGNYWRHEKEWPIARTQYVPYYLHGGAGKPAFSLNDGTLSTEQPKDEKSDEYVADPRNPVPTTGGEGNEGGLPAPQDQRPAEAQSLTYTTEPLKQDVEVTGQVKVVLYASSSAADTDFVATLTDVFPDGRSQYIRNDLLRARYRNGSYKPALLKPGEVYTFTFLMKPTSNLFKAGHRIRVSVAGSSFPKWLPNPNSGKQFGEDTELVKAKNVLYHDAAHASHVVLPIIPAVD